MNLAYVLGELKALPADQRTVFTRIFQTILKDVRMGHPQGKAPDPSTNFGGGFFYGTTPAVANTEFVIAHDFGHAPYLWTSVLPLDEVNAQIVRLKVTRAADATNLYLSSPDINAPIAGLVEG